MDPCTLKRVNHSELNNVEVSNLFRRIIDFEVLDYEGKFAV